jgi:hypothetical protein
MKPLSIFGFFILLSLYSCHQSANKVNRKSLVKTKIINTGKLKQPQLRKLVPVFGYRFTISGDFKGEGNKETLTEHFISSIDHKETNKFYENADYDTLVQLNYRKKPVSLLTCNDKRISDLIIDPKGRSLGLAYLKNEGDLDGDGADEISYVVDWADWSNINFCDIMTYKNHKWRHLYTFEIRDWQLPDMPQTYNQYGIIGLDNKIINTKDTAANRKIADTLKFFKGFIKKIANKKIQVIYATYDGEIDTTIVDIGKHHGVKHLK